MLQCEKCSGLCCKKSPILMLKEEYDRLKPYLKDPIQTFQGLIFILPNPCPLLDKNNKCRVYDKRPLICQCYPYNIIDGMNFGYTTECPQHNRLTDHDKEKGWLLCLKMVKLRFQIQTKMAPYH
jgi:Fe-S-cluster containining protein